MTILLRPHPGSRVHSGTGVLDTVYGYSKVNGYFVVTGKTGDYAAFAYTTDPVNAAWTVKTIDSTVESYLTTKMIWTGTYYVAMGYTRVYDSGDENYDYTPFVYYSTTLTGTWTSYTPSFGTSYYAYSLEYLDGKLIASVQYTLITTQM
jgi:hypothetical protein